MRRPTFWAFVSVVVVASWDLGGDSATGYLAGIWLVATGILYIVGDIEKKND